MLEQGLSEIFVLKGEGIAGGETELQDGELLELYWAFNVVGVNWREWDRWDKIN